MKYKRGESHNLCTHRAAQRVPACDGRPDPAEARHLRLPPLPHDGPIPENHGNGPPPLPGGVNERAFGSRVIRNVNCVFGGTARPTTFVTRNAGYPGGRKGQKNTHSQNRQNNTPTNADRRPLRFRATHREKPVAQAANASPIVATTATSEWGVHPTAIIPKGANRPIGVLVCRTKKEGHSTFRLLSGPFSVPRRTAAQRSSR
jgi:hypothetical protein